MRQKRLLLDSSVSAFWVFNVYFPLAISPSISFHLSSNIFSTTQHLFSLTPLDRQPGSGPFSLEARKGRVWGVAFFPFPSVWLLASKKTARNSGVWHWVIWRTFRHTTRFWTIQKEMTREIPNCCWRSMMRSKMLLSQQIVCHTVSKISFSQCQQPRAASQIFHPGLTIDFHYKIPFSDTLEHILFCACVLSLW